MLVTDATTVGVAEIVMDLVAVVVPEPLATVNVIVFTPAVVYVTEVFCTVDVDGAPPVIVHNHELGPPVLASVKVIGTPVQPVLADVMAAVGVVAATPVILILSK